MYIKSIVLDGFKSYGQRIEISGFDPMFNAITGLNGSGKSNILDSICFVLGITNLTQVRASSLQDLIYKSGQAGINKATVSITFDNRDTAQCPAGFEGIEEITVSRQIILGGKNKYMINGINVTAKKVQDLFCSVQLNVNNPHFLIMQGRITKVLSMKPIEILSMIEEATGTRTYEVKRQQTQKLIDKKDAKLSEFKTIVNEDLSPKIKKLEADQEQYLEYQRIEGQLENLMGVFQVWQYIEAKRHLLVAQKALDNGQLKVKNCEETIEQNKESVKQLEAEIDYISSNKESEDSNKLNEIEARLKEKISQEVKINGSVKSIKNDIAIEEKRRKQLEKNFENDQEALNLKESELSQVQTLFETLKENNRKDSEALAVVERKHEALCAGVEINDEGKEETLLERLMNVKAEAASARRESTDASTYLAHYEKRLNEMKNTVVNKSSNYEKDLAELQQTEKLVAELEASLKKLNFSEDHMSERQHRLQTLLQEAQDLRLQLDRLQSKKPYATFKYTDPEKDFDKSCIKGVVCRLFSCVDNTYATALQTAAGGKMYNVIVDSDKTSKKLLEKGNLPLRTTFIPLNKIRAQRLDPNTTKCAQRLVGEENCQPALSLINYDKSLQVAMEFVFGNVFVCKDIDIARRVTFHDRIKKKCVTLDGDITDPQGILGGGAPENGEPDLIFIQNLIALEEKFKETEKEARHVEQEVNQLKAVHKPYSSLKGKLEITKHKVLLIKDRMFNSSFATREREVDKLETQIADCKEKIKSCQETEVECNRKIKELEVELQDSAGYRKKRLEEVKKELNNAILKSNKSKGEWEEREEYYEMLTLEIQQLKKDLQATKEQIKLSQENIKKLQEEYDKALADSNNIKEAVEGIQKEVQQFKTVIVEKNKDIQERITTKNRLLAENTELELEIKKHKHEIKDLTVSFKTSKTREQEYSKKIGNNNAYLEEGEALSPEKGQELEHKIKVTQEKKRQLGRTINTKAQSMLDLVKKKFNELAGKQRSVEIDRQKLVKMISDLDQKKENALKLAFEQVSKDFGSILGTLLPGANARLAALPGKSLLQGLEIKVALGNVWKESLTELSGGQRSLAALSLILAMLLFKPAPLYILDEVDAALDLSHTQNIGTMLKSHFKKSQFIVVSLKDGMFNNANVLFRTKFIDGVSTVQRTENTRRC